MSFTPGRSRSLAHRCVQAAGRFLAFAAAPDRLGRPVPLNQPRTDAGPLSSPVLDPTPLFEAVRWSYGTELLAAAVAHLGLFELLARGPLPFEEIGAAMG